MKVVFENLGKEQFKDFFLAFYLVYDIQNVILHKKTIEKIQQKTQVIY